MKDHELRTEVAALQRTVSYYRDENEMLRETIRSQYNDFKMLVDHLGLKITTPTRQIKQK